MAAVEGGGHAIAGIGSQHVDSDRARVERTHKLAAGVRRLKSQAIAVALMPNSWANWAASAPSAPSERAVKTRS